MIASSPQPRMFIDELKKANIRIGPSNQPIQRRRYLKFEELEYRLAPTTSTTEVVSSQNPTTPGQNVTFSATVSGNGGLPTGTVTFKDGSANLGAATIPQAIGTWSSQANMPTARNGLAAATANDGRIYAIGGFYFGTTYDTVEAYNPSNNTWVAVSSMPSVRSGLAAATGSDGRIYAIGGNYNGSQNTVQAYNPSNNTWSTVAGMSTPRYGIGVVTGTDGRIYAIGGFNSNGSNYLNTVEAYSPITNSWTTVAPLPTPRYGLTAALGSDGRIYAIGGFDAILGAYTNGVYVYTPSTNTWTTAASMPTARAFLAAVTGPDGRIYAIGGASTSTFNTVEVYTPSTNTWATLESMPTARYNLAAAKSPDGKIYAIGGWDSSNNVGVNTVECLNLSTPSATFSTNSLTIGSHTITAIYSGDTAFSSSTSSNLTQTVVNVPTVSSINPFIGPTSGGNTVVIAGMDFVSVTAVKFGGIDALTYTVISASQINAVAPAGSPATVNLTVTNIAGTSATAGTGDDYSYSLGANVTSVVINGGAIVARDVFGNTPSLANQKSIVEQILVTFDQMVTLDTNAFTITNLAIAVNVLGVAPSAAAVSVVATGVDGTGTYWEGFTQYVLTFAAGSGVNSFQNSAPFGNAFTTLKDGFYQLNTVGSRIHSGAVTAADQADKFWALFGAANVGDVRASTQLGNGSSTMLVDGLALNDAYATFGSRAYLSGPPRYSTPYDWNLDGFVDGVDLNRIYANFGTIWRF